VIHTSAKEADPIDITKLSFTVAGGVGAAVALVVAYRRQRDVEQGRFVERFGHSEPYGWSEDKARQYSTPERPNFGPFIRGHGFGLA